MRRQGSRGFTLIELLVVVAIIGVLSALIIPVIQTAMQKAKQKATMSDISILSKAIMSYITDNGRAPTSPEGEVDLGSEIVGQLNSLHIRPFAITDRWSNALCVWTGLGVGGVFGIDAEEVGIDDYVVQSLGRDGEDEGYVYNPEDPDSSLYLVLDAEDFNRDLIIWNGSWIRAPRVGG